MKTLATVTYTVGAFSDDTIYSLSGSNDPESFTDFTHHELYTCMMIFQMIPFYQCFSQWMFSWQQYGEAEPLMILLAAPFSATTTLTD